MDCMRKLSASVLGLSILRSGKRCVGVREVYVVGDVCGRGPV